MIRWTRECMGVSIKPHYHALVREYVGERKIWSFAGRRGPYRKFNTASAACEYHLKVWTAAVQIAQGEFKGRADRIRALDGRARVGTAPFRGRVMVSVPIWIRRDAADAHRIIKDILFGKPCKSNDPDDQPEESKTSESSSPETRPSGEGQEPTSITQTSGPASNAIVADEHAMPPVESDSRSTASRSRGKTTGAKPAKATAKAPKKSSKPSTKKKSASTESPPTNSTEPSPPAVKRSRSSRKKKD